MAEKDQDSALPVPAAREPLQKLEQRPRHDWQLLAFVFLPFAAAFFLSYLFRTINALISRQLTSDFGLGAADLGLLTSVYFLTFGAAQIPIGVLLDRYGPRRVQSTLLLFAAAGAALFGMSHGFLALVIARAMIGLGVAAALTAGLKAIVLWFPKERVALINGYMIMLGALGAVAATTPAELLIDWTGWRGLFELLAAATAGSAMLIYFAVPESSSPTKGAKPLSLKTVYADRRFWRLAPLSATCVGSAWALQGLWATPWLTDVERLDHASAITQLFIMAIALSLGGLLLGMIADRLRRRGIGPQQLFALVAMLFIAAQLALVLRVGLPTAVPWAIVAIVGAGTVLSYAIVADYFPKELAGRANGALNVFHLGWAFLIQYVIGLVLEQWPRQDGHYPAVAYQVAFSLNVAPQIAAWVWFEAAWLRALASRLGLRLLRTRRTSDGAGGPITRYERDRDAWIDHILSARLEASQWRFAALGSAGLCTALGLALAMSAGRAQVTPYIVAVGHVDEGRSTAAMNGAPLDAEIAFFLARFVKNVRSLSIDPVLVRRNWRDALNYVTDRGAKTLSAYARIAIPFMQIGLQPVEVEVLYVLRASDSSFEIHWKERAYGSGTAARADIFTGTVEIILKPVTTADASSNPLGLYVDAFKWSRDTKR